MKPIFNLFDTVILSTIIVTVTLIPETVYSESPEWMVFNTYNSDLPNNKIKSIAINPQGGILIGTYSGQLAKYDWKGWTIYDSHNSILPQTEITAIVVDPQNNIWIGTSDAGLFKLSNETWTAHNSGLGNTLITSFAVDNFENLWVATDNGLAKLGDTGWTVYSELVNHHISYLATDSQGNIWFLRGRDFLCKFDGDNLNVDSLEIHIDRINSMAIDKEDNIWLAHTGPEGNCCAVYRFNGIEWTSYRDINTKLPDAYHLHPRALTIDSQDNIWIGIGPGCLLKFDRINWEIHEADSSDLPELREITTLATDQYDNIWMGSFGGGIAVYREGGIAVSVAENLGVKLPLPFSLSQNNPNPFNPKTMINYQLPFSNYVELSIYNICGQKLATLVSKNHPTGNYQVEWDASGFASGIYYYQLVAGEYADVKKMILLK